MPTFDTEIPRRHTGSLKWDRRPDLDPFWVADMDFTISSRKSSRPFAGSSRSRGVRIRPARTPAYDRGGPRLSAPAARGMSVTTPEEQVIHFGGLVPALSLAAPKPLPSQEGPLMTCTPVYHPISRTSIKDAGLEPHHRPDHVLRE